MNYLKPNIQLFASAPGATAAGEGDDPAKKGKGAQTDPAAGEEEDPAGTDGGTAADDGLPKSQEELNALIEKRLKREQKKWAKHQDAPPAARPAAPVSAEPSAAAAPAGQTATPAAAVVDDNNAELQKAQRSLVETRAQLTAIKSGISPAVVEDAVLLAIHEVEKDDEDPDDENVADALKDVLKRHPEWKAGKGDTGSGFRVGAGGGDPQQATTDMLNEAFGLTT